MQNISSKHRDRPKSSTDELRKSALSTSVIEKNRDVEAKDLPIYGTVELEDYSNSAIYEEGRESLRNIIPCIIIRILSRQRNRKL